MSHMGTLINALAIVIGSLIGMMVQSRLPKRISDISFILIGVLITLLSTYWLFEAFRPYSTFETLLSVVIRVGFSLVLGGWIGSWFNIDTRLSQAISAIEVRLRLPSVGRAFLNASLLFVIGTLSILGPITEALTGDMSLLVFKALLDGIAAIILASTLGYGVIFSSFTVLLYQGSFYVIAFWVAGQWSLEWLPLLTLVGYVILIFLGLSMMKIKTSKPVNLLPSLLVILLIYFLF